MQREGGDQHVPAADILHAAKLTSMQTAERPPIVPGSSTRSGTAAAMRPACGALPHDARRTCASLLADLDVHPRVAMQILRHAQFSITMEIYTQVSSDQTREALKRLGASLDR
jgi:integrase